MDKREHGKLYRFIRGLLLWLRSYFVLVGILASLGWTLLLVPPAVPKITNTRERPARLTLDLTGKIIEHKPGVFDRLTARFFHAPTQLYLPEARAVLKRASDDERIAQLDLEINGLQGTPAQLTELRDMVAEFRAAGKPVHVLLTDAEEWNYYLASAASDITLNPASPVMITGPSFQLIYFADALKRLGVEIDVVRAGKFKSAFEPFVLDQPSAPTLEEYGALDASLLGHVVEAVAKGRGKTPDEVRGWYKRSIFTGTDAVKAGLVDRLGYGPEAAAKPATADAAEPKKTADAAESSPPDELSFADYSERTGPEKDRGPHAMASVDDKGGIGLIEAVGEISMQGSSNPNSESIAPEPMRRRIRWALENDKVKAVVLRVSSPGGSAIASDMIWHELKVLADAKPLVVSMGAYAASGGYYISAPARRIVAEPTTITGSIGVIGMLPNVSAFKEKYGVSFYIVSGSDRRQMLSPGSRATPEDKALVDSTIDQVYKTFLDRVATGRKMKVEDVAALAQGRVYTGLEAKALGLVDEIGGLQAALKAAKALAGFDANKLYPLLDYDDDATDLHDCLGSVAKMKRCIASGGAFLRATLTDELGRATSPGAPLTTLVGIDPARITASVQLWLEETRREHALALWPGYLGVTLR